MFGWFSYPTHSLDQECEYVPILDEGQLLPKEHPIVGLAILCVKYREGCTGKYLHNYAPSDNHAGLSGSIGIEVESRMDYQGLVEF